MAREQRKPATPEEIWEILREVSESQRETAEQMKETDRKMQDTTDQMKDTDRKMKETDRKMQETDRKIQETAEQMQDTTDQMKDTDRKIKKLNELFVGQWGKLMEALVRGDLVRLLNERDIEVNGLAKETTRKFENKEYEFDIIAVNGDAIVVVEVKTTLELRDVEHFMKKLEIFKQIFSEYQDKDLYGAVAYLKQNQGSGGNAEKKGLYVIEAVGSSARITNRDGFKAKKF